MNRWSDEELNEKLSYWMVPKRIRPYARVLVRGVMQNREAIEQELIKRLESWSLGRMGFVERAVLRLTTYELMFTDVPPKVAVNEAVEIARSFSGEDAREFVNGVLDTVMRESHEDRLPNMG